MMENDVLTMRICNSTIRSNYFLRMIQSRAKPYGFALCLLKTETVDRLRLSS